jgi:DNA-binding transcriptional LysR family regulator
MAEAVNLNRLAYFAAVVDEGSFTRAAERLGITKTVVSQQVARLEKEIGTNLLVRTTRRVQPTEAGRALHARCLTILREADEAFGELSQSNSEPRGTLRVTAPNDFGGSILSPLAAAFTVRHPNCRVELILTDAKLDLVEANMDLSIRVGWLDDSSVLARKIGLFQQVAVATPQLAGRRKAEEPADLATWPFIGNLALRNPFSWTFTNEHDEARSVTLQRTLSINSTPAALAATRAGGGFSILPDFLVADEMREGRLVRLIPNWRLPEGGIHVVYPAARYRPAKVTAFVDMLVEDAKRRPARAPA